MKVLICASGNSGKLSPFVFEQMISLKETGVQVELFLIKGKGVFGYLKNYYSLITKLKNNNFDLIHAHYGLTGLLASLQWKVPVIITFHGSDINKTFNYPFSFLASKLSNKNIFVHSSQPRQLKIKHNSNYIIPCGVDLSVFHPIDKKNARDKLGWDHSKIYILFSSHFKNKVKNSDLAFDSINILSKNIKLIELVGYSKNEVCTLLNAVDLLLVTSKSETGPIIVKEAMACNCPIISTNVGDVEVVTKGVEQCFIVNPYPVNISENIKFLLNNNNRSNGRQFIMDYDLVKIAKQIKVAYSEIIKPRVGYR